MNQQRILLSIGLLAMIGVGLVPPLVAIAQANRPPKSKVPPQPQLSARQIAERTAPSVVLLVTTDEADNPIALGSGFFVEKWLIATNYHVIKDASQVYVKIAGRKGTHKISFIGTPDKENDLVLLRVDNVEGPPLKLGDLSQLHVGDEAYVMGNPEGLEGTFSRGNISAIRNGKGFIQITAPISHGSSGGPVLDERGEVIGVAVGSITEGQNLNFAIPVTKLTALLAEQADSLARLVADSPTSSSAPNEPIPEWRFVTSLGRENYYVSRKRITSTPEHTLVTWIKVVPIDSPGGRALRKDIIDELKKRKINRSEDFSYLMLQREFDCGHQKIHSLREAHYDQKGILLYDLDISKVTTWEPGYPDSYGEALLNFVCKGKQ